MLWNVGNWVTMAAVMAGVSLRVRTLSSPVTVSRRRLIHPLSNPFVLLGMCLNDDSWDIAQRPNDLLLPMFYINTMRKRDG